LGICSSDSNKKLKIKIGQRTIDTRIAWSLIEEVLLLLGRIDIFRLFNIYFQKEKPYLKIENF